MADLDKIEVAADVHTEEKPLEEGAAKDFDANEEYEGSDDGEGGEHEGPGEEGKAPIAEEGEQKPKPAGEKAYYC